MKVEIAYFQPDSVQTVVSPVTQPDTVSPTISVTDSLLKAKPLPFPEERIIEKPEQKVFVPKQRIDPEEQARLEKIKFQNELDSLNQLELEELNESFIKLDIRATEKHTNDTNFFHSEVASQIKENEAISYRSFSPDWIFGILLASSFIIILIRSFYDKYLTLVFKSFHNYQFSYKLYKDPSVLYTQLSYILNLNSALVLGLFFFQVIKYSDTKTIFGFSGFGIYLILPAILIGLYVLQYLVYNFIGDLTLRRSAGKEYLHHGFMLNKILGLIFIPITLCIAYFPDYLRPYLIYLAIATIIVFYFKRIQRGITILTRNHVLKFYWILYFCTLEILPVLILVKLIITFI